MLQINVSQQLKGGIGAVRYAEVDDDIEVAGSEEHVGGRVKLTRTDGGILVQGTLETTAELVCSRCLRPFPYPLRLGIEEEYEQRHDVFSGAALSQEGEPGDFTIDENHIMDLTEAVRQYAGLALPMKPLCREDCAGLPTRGHNLNRGQRQGSVAETAPDWAALAKLAATRGEHS
jgi:uncharacterized protein